MNDCIFCKIIKNKIPADKIYEDDKFLAFIDINPVNYGHSLLLPKEHYENLYDLPDDILAKMAVLLKKISIAVKKATKSDGINIIMNIEDAAGQIVPHAHFHIIPRFADDSLRHWPGKPYINKEEAVKIAEKIKNSLI